MSCALFRGQSPRVMRRRFDIALSDDSPQLDRQQAHAHANTPNSWLQNTFERGVRFQRRKFDHVNGCQVILIKWVLSEYRV
jgi:hypothetical protein